MISFQIRANLGWVTYLASAILVAWFGFSFVWFDIDSQASAKELNKQYSQSSYVATGRVVGVWERERKSQARYAIVEVKRENEFSVFRFESRELRIGDKWRSPAEVKDWFGKEVAVECLRLQLHCRMRLKDREINDVPITFMSAIGAALAILGIWAVIAVFLKRRTIIEQMVYRMRRKSLENFKP